MRWGKVVGLACLMALLVSPAAVFGDVYETFDTYLNGTVSPSSQFNPGNPWTCSIDGNTTCGALTGYGACFPANPGTGVTYIGSGASGTYSPPNVYELAVSSLSVCSATGHSAFSGTHYVQLSAQLNLTSAGVTMSFYHRVSVSTVNINATVFLCNTKVFTGLFNALPSTFTVQKVSALGTIGTACPVVFRLYPVHGATPTAGNWQFDNVAIHNANVVNANANLFMADNALVAGITTVKPQWYNISNFAKSYLELDTPGAAPLTYSNLTAPDIGVIYGSANLMRLWVIPSSYYVQIIPNDATSNTMWLFNPSIVDTYTISIEDLSNRFGPNTTLQISQGTRMLSSGYTDAQNSYPIWIVPGSYNMTLTNGPNTYSQTIAFPSVNGANIPVQILKYTQNGNCGQICTVSYGAGFGAGGTTIVVNYADATITTTSITDQVWVNTALGPVEFYTHTWTPGPFGTLTDIIPCNNSGCNSTLASSISVVLIFTDTYGTNQETIPVSGGNTFATIPNLPQNILGWNVIFPTTPSPLNFAAYLIVLISAASMGAQAAKFGVVVVSAEAAIFSAAGWLPLVNGASLFLMAIAVLAFTGFLEQGR